MSTQSTTKALATFMTGATIALASAVAVAGQYTYPNQVPSGGGLEAFAWSFQDSTVASAFPNPDEGVMLYFWDPDGSTWIINTYDLGAWTNGQQPIRNGDGYLYRNPTDQYKTVTVICDPLTSSQKVFSFSSGKSYLLGYAYLQPNPGINCVECVYGPPPTNFHHMDVSLGYVSAPGDVFYTWLPDTESWRYAQRKSEQDNCSYVPGSPYWEGETPCGWSPGALLSPQIKQGEAFWFMPAANTTWTQKSAATLTPCQ